MEAHTQKPITCVSWYFLLAAILFTTACQRSKKLVQIDPAFSKYIEAYTSGTVSKKTSIRIQLATDANVTHAVNEPISKKLFSFSPSVEGKAYWIDARTIEFKPDQDLSVNTMYDVTFKLDGVIDVPSRYNSFTFNVETIKPSFQVEEYGLKAVGKNTMSLAGQITTADVETSASVEQLLKATINASVQKITWQHNEANKTHAYTVENIARTSGTQSLSLSWDGQPLNIALKDSKDIAIPAIGDFKVLDVRVIQDDEQYALVQFSDPLSIGQSLEGLIGISGQEALSYTILGSEVKVYAPIKLDGNYTVSINEGIQNQWEDKLAKGYTANVYYENRLPSVSLAGKGVILPNSGGKIVLPFDAINLKAVDISIIKIYENNIAQFLQSNKLDGEGYELRKVAKPIVQATVKLDEDKSMNLHKKNRFSLSLDKYIHTEPGAIYSIHIAFRPEYSLYACATTEKAKDDEENENYYDNEDGKVDDDDEFWRRYNDSYPYGYNWEQRNNPCSKGYYNRERFASRNILSTNIGLTAKRGNDNSLFVAVNNIITTDPMQDVELEVLDYQQQIIGKGKTSAEGIALIDIKRKPFLLIAKKGTEKSYLKLDDGSSLLLSKFDVAGAEIKNGIKGFIFGERGVWRPGDSLFLSCIIEDKTNKLPKDHPIELQLISPRGQLYKRIVKPNAEGGFNVFKLATDADAPTGNWTCKVKVGAASFDKKLKIETVMPNRLKINLNFNGLTALGKNTTTTGTLSAAWLFGAKAQNLKAKVDAQLYKKTTTFDKFKDYVFDNPTTAFTTQSKTIFDGSLNAEGTAAISPSFEAGTNAPGMLLANLVVKVFEPGGNFSIDNIALPYHPYTSYAGVHVPESKANWGYLESGKQQRFDLVDVNTDGQLTNGATNLEITLYKIQWRWWWDNSGDGLSNFTQDNYNKLINKQTVTAANGKAIYTANFNEDDWGRYLILVKDTRSGHTTGKTFYVDNESWRSRGNNDDASAATMLSFSTDKEKYNVGEKCTLTIPSGKGGKALISIETGSKVLKTFWTNTETGQTKFDFTIDKDMTPNVYINVSLIQPHAQTINDLPIRMYGVVPILVEDKNTILKPVIKMADVIRPEQNTTITVSETNGKPMTYVIAIVDDGLIDLTHFKTPDPHEYFYAKEALGVKSWDVYDYVIGAFSGELERILTIGGDADGAASKTRKANRFKPVVRFLGPFTTSGGSHAHSFTLPQYMGSVRAMVIAAGNGAYGMAEKTVTVKKPLMMLASLPRVLGPSEEFKIPVTIFATENTIKNVSLSIQGNPFIESAGTQTVSFSKTGEQTVYFNAKVKANTGIGKVTIIASSGKEQAVYETEIDVRNPNPVVTQVTEATLQAGTSYNTLVSMIGDDKSSKATLEVSAIPAINLQKRLGYLINYPHGCIEQTTSAVFPQLALNQLMDIPEDRQRTIDNNIRSAIAKMQNFQQNDGGFSYWPGVEASDEWGTNYGGHFLLEASAKGYVVPTYLLQQWKAYQRNKALAWNVNTAPYYGTDLTQAYRLYLLALAKSPEIGAMNRLKEWNFLTPEGKWRLAAAYYLVGQQQVALQLISGLPTTFTARPFPGVTYGSDTRDQAMVLETLTIMGRRSEAEQLVRTVASKLSQEQWYSTQTTAYALLAIAKYSGVTSGGNKLSYTTNINGKSNAISSNNTIAQNTITWQNGKGNIQIANKGSNVLYVRVINEGKPVSTAPIAVTNNPNVLLVAVNYLSTTGQSIDISKLKQGSDFVAKVTVKNPGTRGAYQQMALSQIFPSGWEILNTRLFNSEGQFKSSASDYMDIKDDRVYQYFNIKAGETLTYYVQLNAAYLGKYFWPGVYCEAMYDNTISGGVSGKWVEVIE
jgi:uncharacterized protein YfaS (alpha-2-macroglobulin family)